MSEHKLNMLNKVTMLSHRLGDTERLLQKTQQVSRTKEEIRKMTLESEKAVAESKRRIAGYRSNLNPVILGDEENTLYDDLSAIADEIGTVQYMLAHGKVREASEILVKVNLLIRGYV